MNDHSAGQAELPRSAYLDKTLRRAWDAAQQRSHRYVTLEHLLWALVDDPDAAELLQAVDADARIVKNTVATALNNNTALVTPGNKPPAFSYKFDNLFAGAFQHAMRSGRKEIDGAFLLVAVAQHPESDASAILAANGFNAQVAQRTLDTALGVQPQVPAPSNFLPPAEARGAKAAAQPKAQSKKPANKDAPPSPAAAISSHAAPHPGSSSGGDRFMEDMLASVRSILDSENRKDWALAPLLNPAATSPATAAKRSQPRPEAQPRPDAQPRPEIVQSAQRASAPPPAPPPPPPSPPPQRAAPPSPSPAPQYAAAAPAPASGPQYLAAPLPAPTLHQPAPPPPAPAYQRPAAPPPGPASYQTQDRGGLPPLRLEPPPPLRPAIAPGPLQLPPPSPAAASSEASASAFKLEAPPPIALQEIPQEKPPQKKRRGAGPKASRARQEPPAGFNEALNSIPRSLRLGRGQIVEIQLGREEAAQLFPRPPQRSQQGGDAVRAVTLRLTAPEGGFFIETMTPETQWLSSRPGSAGEEPFGAWSWAVVPNETGRSMLAVSVLVRDIDANGELAGSQRAEQAVQVRVRANFGRAILGLLRTLFLLAAGAGLAAGAWYVLKAAGKLPF